MKHHLLWGQRLILLSIIAGAAAGIAMSPVFQIRRIVIEAPDVSLATEIAGQIKLPETATTAVLPTAEINRLAGRCHRIKSLSAYRRIPHTLILRVQPREPAAAIAGGPNYTLVDRTGMALIRTDNPGTVPVIRGLVDGRPPLAQPLSADRCEVLDALLESMELTELDPNLTLDVADPHMLRIKTAGGVLGKLGDRSNLARKIVLFSRLLEGLRADGETVEYIDVRIEDRPVWKSARDAGT